MMYGDFDINPKNNREEKHGFFHTGVTKGYGKRWKLKGMQRLRWYCQLCNKQCKDANGFKCHKTSRAHLEMMKSAAALIQDGEDEEFVDHFSQEFEGCFLATLKKKYQDQRVLAEEVYEAYLDDGAELPLTQTMWDSIPHFCAHLEKTGRVDLFESRDGPVIKYIPKAGVDHWATGLPTKSEKKKKEKEVEREPDDVIKQRMIEERIKAAENLGPAPVTVQEATELKKDDNQVIQITFASGQQGLKRSRLMGEEDEDGSDGERKEQDEEGRPKKKPKWIPGEDRDTRRDYRRDERKDERERTFRDDRKDDRRGDRRDDRRDDRKDDRRGDRREDRGNHRAERDRRDDRHTDRLDSTRRSDYDKDSKISKDKETSVPEAKQVAATPKVEKEVFFDHWMRPGLVVKVMHPDILGGALYKRKGVVLQMVDDYQGIIKMLDGAEEKLKIDQSFLETVIPAIGSPVFIVNGKHIGKKGILDSVNFTEFKAVVTVDGEKITKEYEHICKFV